MPTKQVKKALLTLLFFLLIICAQIYIYGCLSSQLFLQQIVTNVTGSERIAGLSCFWWRCIWEL